MLCEDRVAVVTGAGRGIGRAHALELARRGAAVVVNDVGGDLDGSGRGQGPAQAVVAEIEAAGGVAAANTDDISDFEGAGRLIAQAIDEFDRLDVVVNNAGIVRDRMLVNMTPEEFDAVIRVHLRGTFCTTRHAADHWRNRSKAGERVAARVINTTSASGLFGNVGQANYGSAKGAIASMSLIASRELGRYGVTVNAIAPAAVTRMTEGLKLWADQEEAELEAKGAERISPLVAWLASEESAEVSGRVFYVMAKEITVVEGWVKGPSAHAQDRWDAAELGSVVRGLLAEARPPSDLSGRVPEGVSDAS